MNFHPNEIVLIYDPESEIGKQTLAYAKSINNHIREIDYTKTTLTPTSWEQILELVDLEPKKIMDRSSEFYQNRIKGRDIDIDGMLKILVHKPDLLAGPIAIHGKTALVCKNPVDVMKVK
ncbi:glutaredoxin [Hyphobacterium sp. CCMP332]|nr:glutaredoxin [Hyphobacterium sp. CCMP332]